MILAAAPVACNAPGETTGPTNDCDPIICSYPPAPQSPPPPDGIGFRSIWGSSATEVFIVGDRGTIRHYDGTTWLTHASGVTSELTDVGGTSATDLFAVGENGTIVHYDGSAWTARKR